jgi:hypothetical protein
LGIDKVGEGLIREMGLDREEDLSREEDLDKVVVRDSIDKVVLEETEGITKTKEGSHTQEIQV